MELFYTENARTWAVGRYMVNIEALMVFECYELTHCPRPAMSTLSTSGEAMMKLCNYSNICGIKMYTTHPTASFIYLFYLCLHVYSIVLTFRNYFTSFHFFFSPATMERIG